MFIVLGILIIRAQNFVKTHTQKKHEVKNYFVPCAIIGPMNLFFVFKTVRNFLTLAPGEYIYKVFAPLARRSLGFEPMATLIYKFTSILW